MPAHDNFTQRIVVAFLHEKILTGCCSLLEWESTLKCAIYLWSSTKFAHLKGSSQQRGIDHASPEL